jgi:hypothetical protein
MKSEIMQHLDPSAREPVKKKKPAGGPPGPKVHQERSGTRDPGRGPRAKYDEEGNLLEEGYVSFLDVQRACHRFLMARDEPYRRAWLESSKRHEAAKERRRRESEK